MLSKNIFLAIRIQRTFLCLLILNISASPKIHFYFNIQLQSLCGDLARMSTDLKVNILTTNQGTREACREACQSHQSHWVVVQAGSRFIYCTSFNLLFKQGFKQLLFDISRRQQLFKSSFTSNMLGKLFQNIPLQAHGLKSTCFKLGKLILFVV